MASPLTTVPFNTAYNAQTPYAGGATPASFTPAAPPAYGQPVATNKGLNIIINQPYVTGDDSQPGMRPPMPYAPGAFAAGSAPTAQSFPMATDAFGQGAGVPLQPINPALPPADQLTVAYSNANALSNQAVNALAAAEAARKSYLNLGQQLNSQAALAMPAFQQPALPPASAGSLPALPPAQGASPFQSPGIPASPSMQDPFAMANSQQPGQSAPSGFQPPSALGNTPTPANFPIPVPMPGVPSPSGQMPGAASPSPSPAISPEQPPAGTTPISPAPAGGFPQAPNGLNVTPPPSGAPSLLAPELPGQLPGTPNAAAGLNAGAPTPPGAIPGMPPTAPGMPPVPSPLPGASPAPLPGQSPLSGAPAQVLNELLLSSNPQNNEYEQLKQAAKKNKGQAAPDSLIRSGRLQQQDEAIQEIALQAQQPGHAPFPMETFDRLELLANVDTKGLKGQSKEEFDTLRQEALWTLGLLNAAQGSNTPINGLPGLKTMQRIVMDNRESPALRRAAAQGTQASIANRSGTKDAQQFLSQTKSNGKSLLKPWNIFRKDLPKDVKDVLTQTEKGVQIAAPPQAGPEMPNSSAVGQLPGQQSLPGQAMPGQFPGQMPASQPNGLPQPMMPGPSMSGGGAPEFNGINELLPGQDPSMMQAQPDMNGLAGMPPAGMMPGAGQNVVPFQSQQNTLAA